MADRDESMTAITANIADSMPESEQQTVPVTGIDIETQVQEEKLKQEQIKTQRAIDSLEEAKKKASSSAVKEKLQQEIDAAKIRKEEEDRRRKEELETVQAVKTATQTASNVASGIQGAVSHTVDRVQETASNVTGTIATVSTPGTIFLPIALLLIFFFLILPVNGMTRAQWLWMAIVGDARIKGNVQPQTTGGGDVSPENVQPTAAPIYRPQVTTYVNPYLRRT